MFFAILHFVTKFYIDSKFLMSFNEFWMIVWWYSGRFRMRTWDENRRLRPYKTHYYEYFWKKSIFHYESSRFQKIVMFYLLPKLSNQNFYSNEFLSLSILFYSQKYNSNIKPKFYIKTDIKKICLRVNSLHQVILHDI